MAVAGSTFPVRSDCAEGELECYDTQGEKTAEVVSLGVMSAAYGASSLYGFAKANKCTDVRERMVGAPPPMVAERSPSDDESLERSDSTQTANPYGVTEAKPTSASGSESTVPGALTEPEPSRPADAVPPVQEPSVSFGTCFAVGRRDVATSLHVVQGAAAISIVLGDGESTTGTVASRSVATDLAILRIDRNTHDHLVVVGTQQKSIGDRVFTVGFPAPTKLGWEPKYSEGTISSMSAGGEDVLMQVSLPIHPGNSGGPLVDEHGNVVGVIAAKERVAEFYRDTGSLPENIGFAVKADYLLPLLPRGERQRRSKRASRRSAIDRTRRAACKVIAVHR
jgi:S1-C subfamily serine protease